MIPAILLLRMITSSHRQLQSDFDQPAKNEAGYKGDDGLGVRRNAAPTVCHYLSFESWFGMIPGILSGSDEKTLWH